MSAVPVEASPVPAAWDSILVWCALGGVGVVCVMIAAPLVLVVWAVPVFWAAWVDAQIGRLPDRIVLPGAVVTVTLLVVSSLWNGWSRLTGPLIGALLLGVPFLVLHLAMPSGFGFGDVKFGLLLGLGLGVVHPGLAVVVFASAAVLQLIVGWSRLLPAQRAAGADRRSAPFGPSLALAAAIWILIDVVPVGGR